jgi:hypothetical protein
MAASSQECAPGSTNWKSVIKGSEAMNRVMTWLRRTYPLLHKKVFMGSPVSKAMHHNIAHKILEDIAQDKANEAKLWRDRAARGEAAMDRLLSGEVDLLTAPELSEPYSEPRRVKAAEAMAADAEEIAKQAAEAAEAMRGPLKIGVD